ncbi:MAG: hypothetical protein RJA52_449 [Bacteroidota bacterium]
MKVTGFIFFMLFTIRMMSQQLEILDNHIEKLQNAKKYTLEVAELMPQETYAYKPTDDQLNFAEQLVHTGENLYWLSSTYLREVANPIKENKPKAGEMTKEQIMEWLDGAYLYAIESIRLLEEGEMGKEFPWRDGLKLNKWQFIHLIHDHQTHHRGQMIVYLRLNNVIPPKYVGW